MNTRMWLRSIVKKLTGPNNRRDRLGKLRQYHRPQVERVEERLAPATLIVNTPNDNTTSDTFLSLREAISLVNNMGNANAALGRGLTTEEAAQLSETFGTDDTIEFDSAALNGQSITLGGTELSITKSLNISGLGADLLRIDGNFSTRIFQVATNINVTLDGLKLSQGQVSEDFGGAILNRGTLTVTNSKIVGNIAVGTLGFSGGAGIANFGTLYVSNTLFDSNLANRAAGIFNNGTATVTNCTFSTGIGEGFWNNGSITITNSTFSGGAANLTNWGGTMTIDTTSAGGIENILGTVHITNSTLAGGGVGLFNNGGTVNITNTTVSNNSAGGINSRNGGTTTLLNCTITNNGPAGSNNEGAGLFVQGGTVNIKNTIVAGNINNYDVSGVVQSQGNNLIGNIGTNGQGFTNFVRGDRVGGGANPILDAMLGPLQNNGGPTKTHALLSGSPAIDAGNNFGAPTTDQRGISRPQDAYDTGSYIVDIGAFELEGTVSLSQSMVSLASDTIAIGSTVTVTLQVKDKNNANLNNSELVVGFGLGTGTGSGTFGSVSYVGSGAYQATFTATGAGTRAVTATANGQLVTSSAPTITVTAPDLTEPRVASIVRQNPNASPSNASAVTFRITFSEDVQNVDTSDFAVNAGTRGVASVSDSVYDVSVTGLANFNGTLTLSSAGGQNIQDMLGNPLTNTTPTGTSNNTYLLDHAAPASSVNALPTFRPGTFTVTWSGSDGAGAGIANYDVLVSDNGAAATIWKNQTTQTSDDFTGVDGHTYAFFSIARDLLGNTEAAPGSADANTTVDAAAPQSSVAPLPASQDSTTIALSWSGNDGAGAGLATFEIFVSQNNGPFNLWQQFSASTTSATFPGNYGNTYAFYSVATDQVGNRQAVPANAQATTTILNLQNNVTFAAGIVRVGGTDGADQIVLAQAAGKLLVTVNGTSISNQLLLPAIQQIRILGRAGDDTITINNLPKPIFLDGGADPDQVIVNGRGAANIFFLKSTGLLLNDRPIDLDSVESIVLNGRNGNDSLIVPTVPALDVTFNGNAGIDRIQGPERANAWALTGVGMGSVNNSIQFTGVERLLGGGDADTLTGPNQNNVWKITNNNAGKVSGVNFVGFENLVGGSQNDTFNLANGKGVTGQIDGGPGRNTLNYSAYTTPVNVNLTAQTAANLAGGIANIRDVLGGTNADILTGDSLDNLLSGRGGNDRIDGGAGNNILLGGGGNDSLTAGAGRDLLFGGIGQDTFTAGAGEDILFSGPTTFENNLTALDVLAAFWNRGDLDFATRVAQLRAGIPGLPRLNTQSAPPDTFIDTLTGGVDLDWYFARLTPPNTDVINDLEPEELTN
ncbi:MAG: hypothetical protein HYX68_18015 [Planctomycetes bacterium]|nr:hypothetical protein [Planctomycetota bacterium]